MLSLKVLFKGLYKLCACGCGKLLLIVSKNGYIRNYVRGHSLNILNQSKSKNINWKGGIKIHKKYKYKLFPEHPFSTKDGYIFEHRFIMEEHIGRYLTRDEEIHHIDKNKGNNVISNLLLVNSKTHMSYHRKNMDGRKCSECGYLKTKNNKGYQVWYGNDIDGFRCYNCYMKSYRKKNK